MPRVPKNPKNLAPRRKQLLFATIAEYITTGRPVSSSALVKTHALNLSSATIRRELQILTDLGYLVQPHTSAGRVPSDSAFRLFAATLKTQATQIDEEKKAQLLSGLGNLIPKGDRSWQHVVRLLADMSYQAALIVTPDFSDAILRQLRFVPCGPQSLIAVIVTRQGLVHNSYVESKDVLRERDLERIHNYLGGLIEGRSLNDIRNILREELRDARAHCDELRERATLLGSQAIQSSVNQSSELIVEGRSHLLAQIELQESTKELLSVLEEKTRILELLDRAAKKSSDPLVIIGDEGGEGFDGCAMISAPFGGHGPEGKIGIIGSMRMNYSAIIPLVAAAAQFLSKHFSGDEGE